jgi:hypothetical protein
VTAIKQTFWQYNCWVVASGLSHNAHSMSVHLTVIALSHHEYTSEHSDIHNTLL